MKKILKSRIFIFIISGLIFGSIGVYAATLYSAEQISYEGSNGSTNVKDALDGLYDLVGGGAIDLLWENPDGGSNFAGQTITINNLEEYDYFLVLHYFPGVEINLISVNGSGRLSNSNGSTLYTSRDVSSTGNTITFGQAGLYAFTGNMNNPVMLHVGGSYNTYVRPLKILGVKTDTSI